MFRFRNDILQHLALVGQFGVSLVVPVVAFLWGAWWLTDRFGIGGWIFIPALVLGLGTAFATAWNLYLRTTGRAEKEKQEDADEVRISRHL